MTTSVVEMWRGNPALACVLFGLPLGFFALICYSICCADIMDAEDEDEEEELLNAQGKQISTKQTGGVCKYKSTEEMTQLSNL